jgi:hypothetical protein
MKRTCRVRIAAVALSFLLAVCVPVVAFAQVSSSRLSWVSPIEAAPRAGPVDAGAPPILPNASAAQNAAPSSDLNVSVYPILLWAPFFTATTVVPPFPDAPNGPDLPGGSGSTPASLDGAALAGISIEKGIWRVDADGIWAALVTTREVPLLDIDLDIIYGHVSGGVKIYKDLYVTGGVRRVALNYDIQLGDRPQHFVREAGIWDPLVGLGWHSALGSRWTVRAVAEGGGFGVGADVDFGGSVRADMKIASHVGLTFGYGLLYLKLSDTVLQRTFEVKQTLHGPVLGLGLFF